MEMTDTNEILKRVHSLLEILEPHAERSMERYGIPGVAVMERFRETKKLVESAKEE